VTIKHRRGFQITLAKTQRRYRDKSGHTVQREMSRLEAAGKREEAKEYT
jgi:hypothetical protein